MYNINASHNDSSYYNNPVNYSRLNVNDSPWIYVQLYNIQVMYINIQVMYIEHNLQQMQPLVN